MNAYDAYKKYVALKLHFNQLDYDYFKFSGGVRLSKDKFETRNDKYFFQRVTKIYNDTQFEQLLVSNFILNKDAWVGEVLSDIGRNRYTEWKKNIQSIEYIFTQDMNTLKLIVDESVGFDSLFVNDSNSNWPKIIDLVFQQTIKLESFIIMNKILNFIPNFNKTVQDTLVWPEFYMLCIKYSPFISMDKNKYKKIMKSIFI